MKNDDFIFANFFVVNLLLSHSYSFPNRLDNNECNSASHGCEQKCVNEHGSYSCACLKGYQLNTDNKTCAG